VNDFLRALIAPTCATLLIVLSSLICFVAPANAVGQDVATPVPTRDANNILVWWPAPLYPQEKSPAFRLLRDQVETYQSARGQTVTIRVKRAEGLGGIFQTLRSGSVAAPSSMPDLALMRRSDLVQAAASKLIQPFDIRTLTSVDLFDSAIALGQINSVQYGIPFTLEIQHAIYRNAALTTPPQTLNDVLQTKQPSLVPASATRGVNTTLLAQYLAAGGHILTVF
jgi:maltose-binding protein MalE